MLIYDATSKLVLYDNTSAIKNYVVSIGTITDISILSDLLLNSPADPSRGVTRFSFCRV